MLIEWCVCTNVCAYVCTYVSICVPMYLCIHRMYIMHDGRLRPSLYSGTSKESTGMLMVSVREKEGKGREGKGEGEGERDGTGHPFALIPFQVLVASHL